jgi:zinc protease
VILPANVLPGGAAFPRRRARRRLPLPAALGSLPKPHLTVTLPSGLQVAVLESRRAPVVSTAIVYRAGTADEAPGQGGIAHFLEHMMFKGAARHGLGEIDRITRALGGVNNAFTSHDSTLYYFTFAADRWQTALDLELDRLESLLLDKAEVKSERQVILEEIAMYEGDPWDALDQAVHTAFYGEHPYGKPVLGTRETLKKIGDKELRAFHRRFYQPANAVVVVVGDVEPEVAVAAVEARFGKLPAGEAPPRFENFPAPPGKAARLERRQVEVARMLAAVPGPDARHPDHPLVRLLLNVAGSGRSSRLHRALVDHGQLCVWATADIGESASDGNTVLAAEVIPGIEPARVEELLFAEMRRLVAEPPTDEELARARRMVHADWLFGHEKVDQQAFLIGAALALFDADHPWRSQERLLHAQRDELAAAAEKWLQGLEDKAVVGWSLPHGDGEPAPPAGA